MRLVLGYYTLKVPICPLEGPLFLCCHYSLITYPKSSIVILLQKLLDVICDAENVPNQNEGLLQCQNAQLMDHIYSQNKLIDALNLRKTSVYV